MAEPLPAALKIPEVSRFINRANQLRSIKPAIAYWCEYHAVNQIVGKGLHNTDDDTFEFTKTLIERLETTKTERADDDAIVDNAAGQAYVEQFAQQTFDRAERTLRANKVTRQTADTFDAAATFFDLTREWGDPDPEVVKKIKFAKWNAARILKAIREGKDPNETNPNAPEPEPEVALDPSDPEVQALSGVPRASVEDAPDAGDPPSVPTFTDAPPRIPDDPGYFPPQPQHQPQPEPFVPSPLSQSPTPGLPGGPPSPPPVGLPPTVSPVPETPAQPATQIPPQPSPQIPTKLPSHFAPPPPQPFIPSAPPSWTPTPSAPHPAAANPPPVIPQAPAPQPSAPAPAPVPVQTTGFATDHRDINQAQKHAKWAISALNFEDVPTAVQELRNALRMLGAQ
ncbi:vacuolar sorting-associated VTA1 like [Fusarium beomiforme]|uniref:Vacuolar sorting-associated VTA1 like n=1 Tax=Fusarium beomiforme TaxID=44412 RepID=A0A9P5E3B0_9HYPO|nr:vacuolar sorting-associated VTA1 like [Fusarium beomiforme]